MKETDQDYKRYNKMNKVNENTYKRSIGADTYSCNKEWMEYCMQYEDYDMTGYDVYGRWYGSLDDLNIGGSKIG